MPRHSLFAVFMLGGVLLLSGCGRHEPQVEPPRPVLTMTVGATAGETGAIYSGEVRSRHETALAFRVGGKLVKRLVDNGAIVRRGQLLARLDPADYTLSAGAAAAQLALAEAELKRFRDLRAQNFVSQAALDAKETAWKAAQAQNALAQNQSAYTELRATDDGVVGVVAAEVGQVLSPGQTVFRVARQDTLEVAIAIPESRISAFRAFRDGEAWLWATPERRYQARLREITPVADPLTRTFAARVSIVDADAAVVLGMTANVRFASAAPAGVEVPLTALYQKDGGHAVWVVAADQTVELRPVSVTAYGEKQALLGDGVQAGERIVVAGVHKLTAGEKIAPVTRDQQ